MKELNVFIFTVILICINTESFAQQIAIKGGLNLSNMLLKDEDGAFTEDMKMLSGFHAGMTVDFPVQQMFSVETGLLLSTKGFKMEMNESYGGQTISASAKMSLLYLDIPVLAKITYPVGENSIFGAIGPSLGIGLTGKSKATASYAGESESDEENIKWGSDQDEDDLKRFDMGLSFGAGYNLKSFQLGVSYDLGLLNISPYTGEGTKISNRVFRVSVGFVLSSKE